MTGERAESEPLSSEASNIERSVWASPDSVPVVVAVPEQDQPAGRTGRSRHIAMFQTVAVAVLFLAASSAGVAAAMWANGEDPHAAPAQGPNQGARPGASPTEPSADLYRAPIDLCQEADFTGLRPTFNTLGDLASELDTSAGFFTAAVCEGSTGNETVQGRFALRVSVFANPDTAAAEFGAIRAQVEKLAATAQVAGIGKSAYSYNEPGAGPTVQAYAGNLMVRLTWAPVDRSDAPPEGTAQALADVCWSTIKVLRAI